MTKQAILDAIHGSIIVSCQALPGEPLYVEEKSIMYLMARAAKQAGAVAIRTNGVRDITAIKEETGLPVIGLIKQQYPGIDPYITPSMAEVDALHAAGADIVALDCTLRPHKDHAHINDFLRQIKSSYPDMLLMADISTYEEGVNAAEQGVDFVGTTMSGYTPYSIRQTEPDYALVSRLVKALPNTPIIAEGRVHEPPQAVKLLQAGAFAVVVGGAITRPLEIATRFVSAVHADAP